MNIRPAVTGDAAEIARLQIASYRATYAGLLPQAYLDRFDEADQAADWRRLIDGPTAGILLVADHGGGGLAGYALGRSPIRGADDGELVALHVRGEAQRQGVGRALVRAMAHTLADRGASRLTVWVLKGNPAVRFYESLGGQAAGKRIMWLDEGVEAVESGFVWDDIGCLTGDGGGQLELD